MHKAVLFDLDGTLLDTFDFIYGAFEFALSSHGAPILSRAEIASKMGGPLEECYQQLVPDYDHLSLTATHRDFQASNLHLVHLFPGTVAALEHLKQKDYRIAAVTTRSVRTSIASLSATAILEFFDLVLSVEDVERPKPDPDPIFKAATALNVTPAECAMVGDTYADIVCGKNAGAYTIAALYGFGNESLLALQPDAAITDILQLTELL